MRFDNYEFRCSDLGKIMSNKGDLTQSNKTYLTEVFICEKNGIRKEISSKFLEKGNLTEQDGLTLLNKAIYPNNLLIKNTERRHNGWIHGEADCIAPDDIIYDIKNAWDKISFGKADLTTDYYWQLVGYMWLWGKNKARLFYCLNNMPEVLLIDEERKLFYANHFVTYEDPEYQKLCEEMRAKHNYDDMKLEERFKVWDVEHSDEEIGKLKTKILKCRKFLNDLYEKEMERIKYNRSLMGLPDVIIAEHDKEVNATIVDGI